MKPKFPLLLFRVGTQRFAVCVDAVERILRAVEVTPVPNGPDLLLGMVDLEGRILPVLSFRRRLGESERELRPSDHFLIAKTSTRTVALLIDEALGVLEAAAISPVPLASKPPGLAPLHGILQLEEGMIFIHDLEQFLSPDEAHAVEEALAQEAAHGS